MKDIVKVSGISKSSAIQESITPENLINRFLAYLDCSAQTTRTYKHGIRRFVSYLHSENISKPTRETVIAFKKELATKGLKPSTIALYLSSSRRFFAWCSSEKLYEDITLGVKSPKMQSGHKRDYLSGSQIAGMLQNTQSKRDYAVIALIATTGLRTVEVVRADIGDIHNVSGVWLLDIQGKGHASKDAYVKLSQPVYEAIQEYLSERGKVKPNEPLFVSESRRNAGKRLTTRTISGVCKHAMRQAGYDSPRLTAHSLRHSAATLSLLAGMELSDVQQFMRHTSISTTMIYNHSVQRMKSMCESAVTSAIFGERLSA